MYPHQATNTFTTLTIAVTLPVSGVKKLSSGGVLLNFTKMYQNLTLSLTQVTHNKFLLP